MDTELKTILQEKLTARFRTFSEIPNSTFQVMPMGKDIPVIKKATYNKRSDVFEIFLEHSDNFIEKEIVEGSTIMYFDKVSHKLVGIKINNFGKLINAAIAKVLLELKKNEDVYKSSKEVPFSYKEVEKRKFQFFEDVVHESLHFKKYAL